MKELQMQREILKFETETGSACERVTVIAGLDVPVSVWRPEEQTLKLFKSYLSFSQPVFFLTTSFCVLYVWVFPVQFFTGTTRWPDEKEEQHGHLLTVEHI